MFVKGISSAQDCRPVGNEPPGVNRPSGRKPIFRVVSGDTWPVEAILRVPFTGEPATPENSFAEFVLSENRFSPPIWTGRWIDGIHQDGNRPGLVHVRIPREVTKSLRRGAYSFSVRVSDAMRSAFETQAAGSFLVEYEPSSDQRSIPYRDGTSEVFPSWECSPDAEECCRRGIGEIAMALDTVLGHPPPPGGGCGNAPPPPGGGCGNAPPPPGGGCGNAPPPPGGGCGCGWPSGECEEGGVPDGDD